MPTNLEKIQPTDQFIFDAETGALIGIKNPRGNGPDMLVGGWPQRLTIAAGSPARTITLIDGQAAVLVGSSTAVGTVQRYDSTGAISGSAVAIAASQTKSFGPYSGTNKILVSATAGTIDATIINSALNVPLFDPSIPKSGIANFQGATNGNIATRMLDGHCTAIVDNTAGFTWELVCSLAIDSLVDGADSVRWIFGQSRIGGIASAAPNMLASMYAPSSFTDADASTFPTQVAVGGVTSGWVFPAPTTDSAMAYVVSDWQSLSTVARSDGGKNALVGCRAWLVNGGRLVLMTADIGGGETYDAWSTRPVTERQHRIRKATTSGNFAGGSAFTGALNSTCPILGLQYQARGRVYTIGFWGDSITTGRDTYVGEGVGMKIAEKINALNLGFRVETMQCGWSGAFSPTWSANIKTTFAAGLVPDVVSYKIATPNDFASTITALGLTQERQRYSLRAADTLAAKPLKLMFENFAPSNTASKTYAATDALRIAFNSSLDTSGTTIMDVSTTMSGVVDGTGQMQIVPAYSLDGLHFKLVGEDAAATANLNKVINLLAWK